MLIVFNPVAGAGRPRRLARALTALRRLGVQPDLAETCGPGDARAIAHHAAARGEAVVVAAGGDGTIAEVAEGLAGSAAVLGVLPFGTANVLAWELGLNTAPEAAAAVLAGGRVGLLRPGVARFGDGRCRLFVQMVGAGFDAAVVASLPPGLKRRLGRGAYVVQALRTLPRYPFAAIEVAIDDAAPRGLSGATSVPITSVIVSKGRLYAGRFLLAPAARPAEPGFQVALFHAGALAAALAGAALPLGLLPRLPGVELRAAARVRLSAVGIPVQADGDAAGLLPVSIEDAAAPLRILLPRQSR